MNTSNLTRIETLNKNNYDMWKMQMEALLIKNDAWLYINDDYTKPEMIAGDPSSESQVRS